MLCNNLEGWDVVGSGKEAQDGEEICVYMAESLVVWTKPTVQSTYSAIKKTKNHHPFMVNKISRKWAYSEPIST